MACVTTPTATRDVAVTRESTFTTTVTVETSLPTEFVTTTFLTDNCAFNTVVSSTTCTPVLTTSVLTIPGENTTITTTEITTIPYTTFEPSTLFGTSCPPDEPPPTPEPPVSPPITPPPSSTPTSTSSSSSYESSISTGSSSESVEPSATSDSQQGESINLAPIIGGAVGGFVGLLAIAIVTWFFLKKAGFGKAKFDNVFNKDDDLEEIRHTHPEKPVINFGYQGGQAGLQGMGPDPSTQPPPDNANHGYQPQQQQPQGQPTQQPANLPVHPNGATGVEYQPQGNESEMPDLDHASHNPMAPPNNLGHLPSGVPVAPFVVNQVYPPRQPQQHHGHPTTYQPHQAQVVPQGYYPPSNVSYAPSAVSTTSLGVPPGHYGPPQGVPPHAMAAPAVVGHARNQFVSSVGRSGSPVSIQNSQVLQVMNPETLYSYNNEGSSSASGSGSANAAASSSTVSYPVDGKGRPVGTRGEKAPIVHLDGGRYEETAVAPLEGTTHPPSGAAPPAYTPS